MKTIAFIYETTKFYEELKKYTSPIIDTSKTLISWWMINETDTDSPDLFRKNYCNAGNAGLKRMFDEQKVDFVVIEYQEDTALMHKLFSYLDDQNSCAGLRREKCFQFVLVRSFDSEAFQTADTHAERQE
jgi:hypothetical protein